MGPPPANGPTLSVPPPSRTPPIASATAVSTPPAAPAPAASPSPAASKSPSTDSAVSPNPTSMSYSSEHAATKTASEDGEDAGFLNNFTKLFNRGTTKHATLVFPLSTPLLPPKTLGPKIMEISAPTGFKHEVHVGFDKESGDFTGLPNEWKNLLDSSGISREEQANNPQVKKRLKHPHLDGELIRNFFFLYAGCAGCAGLFHQGQAGGHLLQIWSPGPDKHEEACWCPFSLIALTSLIACPNTCRRACMSLFFSLPFLIEHI